MKRSLCLSFVLSLLAGPATTGSAGPESLRVGAVTARPGEKVCGYLVVPDGARTART